MKTAPAWNDYFHQPYTHTYIHLRVFARFRVHIIQKLGRQAGRAGRAGNFGSSFFFFWFFIQIGSAAVLHRSIAPILSFYILHIPISFFMYTQLGCICLFVVDIFCLPFFFSSSMILIHTHWYHIQVLQFWSYGFFLSLPELISRIYAVNDDIINYIQLYNMHKLNPSSTFQPVWYRCRCPKTITMNPVHMYKSEI